AVPTGASQGVPAPLLPRPAFLAPRRAASLRYSGAPQLRGHRRPGTAERPAMPARHLSPRRAWVDSAGLGRSRRLAWRVAVLHPGVSPLRVSHGPERRVAGRDGAFGESAGGGNDWLTTRSS